MSVAARFRTFLLEAPHWIDLLAQVPAHHVQRHDTVHPAFHGCIDWHSACHAVWALLAHRGLTGDARYEAIVDQILMPRKLAEEAADLAARPEFEMPYGRAWFLRLALEDRAVTGSTRLTFVARDTAESIVAHYRSEPPKPLSREYANPCWAMINLWDYAQAENRSDLATFVRETTEEHILPCLETLPSPEEEASWSDFMAVTPNLCEVVVRSKAATVETVLAKVGDRLHALSPVTEPKKPHHYALNFSRAWALFALYEASGDERLLAGYLDHMEMSLKHPSWWRGDYRTVAHWVPQFGMFALQRALKWKS
ncbi:MAG TPA: DUF2891 family protein [Rhizomicrobium sp.]|jgi:hypothetical protein